MNATRAVVPTQEETPVPVPEFIAHLRLKIDHDLLWLPGCTAVVLHEGRVLLGGARTTGTGV